ncbi:MAG: AAA family ATPase [Rhizobiales bacterium]|nr:AAA family ATPase [Hyphomicrobiales bacterium]
MAHGARPAGRYPDSDEAPGFSEEGGEPIGGHTRALSISERALAAAGRAQGSASYLEGLNPEQRAAVETLEGPVLVLAGAGTGKTRVLTTRIAHILASGRAWPSQILAVTFTNKAAREMKERIGRIVGGAVEGMPWLGTFHSIGVKILRRHAELVDLKSGFTILDTDDQIRLLKQLIEAEGLDAKRWPARQLANLIDGWKNRGLTPARVPAGEALAFADGKGGDLYRQYQVRLKELNAVDFGDLLLECTRLFLEHPDVLAEYHRRFRFLLVDEYQDTNVAQYLWLRLLAQGSNNVCCVGDDDQSIYGWRGAEVDNILRFEADFPGARVFRVETNYRSTGHILAAASGLIAHNRGRLGKTLRTDGAPGERVTVTGVWDDEEEARTIGEGIESLRRTGHKLNEVAILVRASFQMRAFEDRFVTTGLPYRVIGGPRFYERQEIKDAIAYLEVTLNPANDIKLERIVNVPKRGIGETSVRRIITHARSRGISLHDAAVEMSQSEELTGKTRKSLADLLGQCARWRKLAGEMSHTDLAEIILDESGYTAMWQADKSPQAHTRLENLKELVRFMGAFDTLAGFLEHVSLVMDAEADSDGDRVSLMTLHAAKGLEFDTVYLPGWEEGLFPHQRALDESGQAGLEEERRLAYVGVTRARKRAHISFAQNRRVHALWQSAIPSRFVDELPEAHVDVIEAARSGARHGGYGLSRFETPAAGFANTYATPGWQRAQKQWNAEPERRRDAGPRTIDGEIVASSTRQSGRFKTGSRVNHAKFGLGTVAQVDGSKLVIDFDDAGRKHVVDSFVTAV